MSLYDRQWYRVLSWFALLAYMGVIFYLSSLSMLPVALNYPYEDKVVHAGAYFVMGFLAGNAFADGTHKRRFWLAFALVSLYGISDEFHQMFVPGRESSIKDWFADVVGAWLGVYLYLKSEPVWRKTGRDPLPR